MIETVLDYDQCLENLRALTAYYASHAGTRNEATTRFHLIDTLLYQCLGWAKQDCYVEEPHEGEFSDYTFFAPRRIMILEAKKEGDYFEVPAGKVALTYRIKSLWQGNDGLKAAMKQVASYCQERGIPLGAFSNGHQMVAFLAARNDGVPPFDGQCVVFPSLAYMLEHFVSLWNLLSRHGVEDKNLEIKLLGESRPSLPPVLATKLTSYPGHINREI